MPKECYDPAVRVSPRDWISLAISRASVASVRFIPFTSGWPLARESRGEAESREPCRARRRIDEHIGRGHVAMNETLPMQTA